MKKIENGSTTTTGAKEEVKFYVDLEKREISRSTKTLKHIGCILKENQPYYYVEAVEGIVKDQLLKTFVECRNMKYDDAKAKAEKVAVDIRQFKNPYTPSEYEEVKDAVLADVVENTKDFNLKKSKSKKCNNDLEIKLYKATIIFDEMLQAHRLEIEEVEKSYFTIYADGEVE